LTQSFAQHAGKTVFDPPRNQTSLIQIFEVGFILRTKTSQLHSNQIRQRNQSNSLQRTAATQIRRRFRFTCKNQAHRTPRRWTGRLHKHVRPGHMAMLQPKTFSGLRDLLQVLPADDYIDVPGKPPRIRIRILHIQVNCQAADNPVFKAGRRKIVSTNPAKSNSCSTRVSKNTLPKTATPTFPRSSRQSRPDPSPETASHAGVRSSPTPTRARNR
jgi:hypothetical protein